MVTIAYTLCEKVFEHPIACMIWKNSQMNIYLCCMSVSTPKRAEGIVGRPRITCWNQYIFNFLSTLHEATVHACIVSINKYAETIKIAALNFSQHCR